MKEVYIQIAESYENLAKCYRSLAEIKNSSENKKDTVPIKNETLIQKGEAVVDITTVRKALAEKTQAGKSKEVKTLLIKYGANKLSAIAPENFKSLLQEAEEL